ncbi:Calpain catalytic domain-containing protein [Rhodovastum atsumiense]|nr:C2 family cysteine protease [Rhodovastum atsumiense]CAH2602485.1 Calpain catalytic domain-containing protein [Rhodovastum atsumiense]
MTFQTEERSIPVNPTAGVSDDPSWGWQDGFSAAGLPAGLTAATAVQATGGGAAVSSLAGAPATSSTLTTSGGSIAYTSASWIVSLGDPVIKADMTTASADGVVTEVEMARLFTDLVTALASSHTTLSSSQFADLRTIAANLNVGESASSYVSYLTNALVLGNAANAKWTGGGTTATTLGNLAVGSTADQLSRLTGKWFLGTDLPSSTVSVSGTSFTVTYSVVQKPLYGSGGPSVNDINQGRLGDCYLLSSLAEVACRNPSIINDMITDNGNGTYGVRFFANGVAQYVTVANTLAGGGTVFNRGTALWGSLVEQAFAQFQASGITTGNSAYNYGNSFSSIGNGGFVANALEAITGATSITNYYAGNGSWEKDVLNGSLNWQNSTYNLSSASVLSAIAAALANGNDVILSSYTDAYDSSGRQTLVASHAMSVYGYNSSTQMLQIRNPWGSVSYGQTWNTTFEVSLSTLLAAGDVITIDNVGGGAGPSNVVTNALVSAAAGLQANAQVASFTIADTAANVVAGLSALAGDTKLSAITLTDATTPSLTLTNAAYAAGSAVLAKITSGFTLTVTGATVAGAAALQANAKVTSFTVSDTAARVVAGLSALAADAKLGAITLTDASRPSLTLTGAAYTAGSAALARISSTYTLVVTGATVISAAALQANAKVTSFTVSDTAANVVAGLSALGADTKLGTITLTDASRPSLTLTSAAFAAGSAALARISSTYTLAVTGATVAGAAALQANAKVTSFTVGDTAANVVAGLSALKADTKLGAITLTDAGQPSLTLTSAAYTAGSAVIAKITGSYTLAVTGATVGTATALQGNAKVTSFTVGDTAANVVTGLSALASDAKLSAITLTDAGRPSLTLTSAAFTAGSAVLAKITSSYNLTVTGATVGTAAALQGNAKVTSFTIGDTAANVVAGLSALGADAKLGTITLTDAGRPSLTLTSAAYSAGSAVLAKITSSYTLAVTGVAVANATTLQGNAKVTSFAIGDTAANVVAGLSALKADTKLNAITLTDAGRPSLALTSAAYSAGSAVLAKITSSYDLVVTGASVTNAAALQANAKVTSFTLSDTAANVKAALPALNADTKLTQMTIVGTAGADTLDLTNSRVAATINLGNNTALVSAGLGSPSLTFATPGDSIRLGSAAEVINYTLASNGGIETIANFQFGVDQLVLNLNGASASVLRTADTLVNGQHAVTIYGGTSPTAGVVLTGLDSSMTASILRSGHTSIANGYVTIT